MNENFKNKKILIVDDTAFMRNALCKILTELGFPLGYIEQAENGKVGLEILNKTYAEKKQPFDLVFCDWNMPTMTGIEFLKAVRKSPALFKDIPFILVTTDSEKEKVIEAVKYKVTDYIIKPVTKESIEGCLDAMEW
ncbi:MAG: response regulator [Bdellovibrionales bacterium CG12_big_fil_rev_8_21_14_0_65_38_15]|nr:MAG: response regulator [Bdellovibrionales bacterium CG22_combo_CG10-13_8_21_14_all_38_13]PIQ56630.1 MAG: response regulator [Bdellovibrionales bacterium CG12_big_fil_rev_8_21_14_0_65_38_15]PIR31253.1 MAG: response regulator [Bdellovibrionales bacterium CG11_big_fil_rev_8_21_14_0_20_38_13]